MSSLHNSMKRIRNRIEAVFPAVLGLLLALLVFTEVLQVIGRYLFGVGFPWVQDFLSIILLSLGWLGCAYLWFAKKHLAVDIIGLPDRMKLNWIQPIADILMVVAILILLPAVNDAIDAYSGLLLDSLPISASIKYVPCFVALCLLGMGAVLNLIEFALVKNAHTNA